MSGGKKDSKSGLKRLGARDRILYLHSVRIVDSFRQSKALLINWCSKTGMRVALETKSVFRALRIIVPKSRHGVLPLRVSRSCNAIKNKHSP